MNEIRPDVAASNFPPHLGPAIPELSSIWFKMYLYHVTQTGPPSLLLPKGSRPCRLPKVFHQCNKLLVTSWGNEPSIIPVGGALSMLLDALQHSPVLIQAYMAETINSDGTLSSETRKNIPFEHPPHGIADMKGGGVPADKSNCLTTTLPFPMKLNPQSAGSDNNWLIKHPCLDKVTTAIDIEHACGYITLINLKSLKIPQAKNTDNSDTINKSKEAPENGKINKENAELLEEELNSCLKDTTLEDKAIPISRDSKDNEKTSETNWVLLDVNFGIPLFNPELNKSICDRIISHDLLKSESLKMLGESSRNVCLRLLEFIADFQDLPIVCGTRPFPPKTNVDIASQSSDLALPTRELFFDGHKLHVLN